ncbi:MAG: DUF1735 domain-containing protein [Bacteroidales bacterium]
MKKILAFIAIAILMVSCYEDYIVDYPYTAIYFPFTQNVRTFVVGEGMKFEVGAALGGVSDNKVDRNVDFILDNTLITPAALAALKASSSTYIKNATTAVTTLEQLPTTHYSMTPSTSVMVIKKGWYSGTVVIKADSTAYCNDSLKTTKLSTYALPFRITGCDDVDSILPAKRTQIVGTMLENMLFGNYWHGGQATVDRSVIGKADSTVKYYTAIPTLENRIWTLTTLGPQTLSINSYYNAVSGAAAQIKLVLKGNNVYLSSLPTSAYVITPDGPCTFNRSKLLQDRRIYLKYKFTTANGFVYHCTDTLRFRNRIRDGVNEWQDENPSHYTK